MAPARLVRKTGSQAGPPPFSLWYVALLPYLLLLWFLSACGRSSIGDDSSGAPTTEVALDVFVLFDRSGSMNECADGTPFSENAGCPSPPTRWDVASTELVEFFRDPESAGLGVALRFFPHDKPVGGCRANVCDPAACAVPLVDLDRLSESPAPDDAHEVLLDWAVRSSFPRPIDERGDFEGTPTSVALEGALSWALGREASPERTTAVVFVTDGEPNGCEEDFAYISGVAERLVAEAGVRTFVVRLGSTEEPGLDAIARAGETDAARIVFDGAGPGDDLSAVLSAIRDEAGQLRD